MYILPFKADRSSYFHFGILLRAIPLSVTLTCKVKQSLYRPIKGL